MLITHCPACGAEYRPTAPQYPTTLDMCMACLCIIETQRKPEVSKDYVVEVKCYDYSGRMVRADEESLMQDLAVLLRMIEGPVHFQVTGPTTAAECRRVDNGN